MPTPTLAPVAQLPMVAVAIGIASFFLYAMARAAAYRLYVPGRFLELGLPIAALAFVIGVFASLGRGMPTSQRRGLHHLVTGLGMLAFWTFVGPGHNHQAGMSINERGLARGP